MSVKHKRIPGGGVVTEGQRGRAELLLRDPEEKGPIPSLHSHTQLVLIHNPLGLLGRSASCFAALTGVSGCQRNPSLCCRWLSQRNFFYGVFSRVTAVA